jgi:hypothetical protein
MTTLTTDGRVRKSLAEQLDRFDRILDGLADGLNEAVATAVTAAVRVAVKEAVQAILAELVTHPAVREQLGGAAPPARRPAAAALLQGLRQRLGRVAAWVGRRLKAVCRATVTLRGQGLRAGAALGRRAWQSCAALWARVLWLRHWEVPLLTALGLGGAAGTAAYLAGPWLAAGVSALGGLTTPWALRAGRWLRRRGGASAVANL